MLVSLIMLLIALVLLAVVYSRWRVERAKADCPPEGRFVEVEGVRLHYKEKGEGVPVVFLHGGILSAKDYDQVMEKAPKAFRMLSFDRPGYGYSERPKKEMATPRIQARLLRGALQKLGVRKPILVAHSWSASLALSYALKDSKDLSGLVLLAPGAYGGKAFPVGKADHVLNTVVGAPIIGDLLLNTLLVPLGRRAADTALKTTFAPDPVPGAYRRVAKALWPRPGQFKANREDIRGYLADISKLQPHYRKLSLPVKIVVGEADPFHPDQQSYRLSRDIPHATLTVLPDTGHMIPQTRPEAVWEAVRTVEQQVNRASTIPSP